MSRTAEPATALRLHFRSVVPATLLAVVGLVSSLPAPAEAQKPQEAPRPREVPKSKEDPKPKESPKPATKGGGPQWPMAAKDYANTRYSDLADITTANVRDLQIAWTFETGVHRGQEAAPIVVHDVMYVVTPFPNILYALDLARPGMVRWEYEPKPSSSTGRPAKSCRPPRSCASPPARAWT